MGCPVMGAASVVDQVGEVLFVALCRADVEPARHHRIGSGTLTASSHGRRTPKSTTSATSGNTSSRTGTTANSNPTAAATRVARLSWARTSPRIIASPISVCSCTSTRVRTIRAPRRLASTTRSRAGGTAPGDVTSTSSSDADRG